MNQHWKNIHRRSCWPQILAKQKATSGHLKAGARKAGPAASGTYVGLKKGSKIIAEHTVKKGDTLSAIAKRYYGSGAKQYYELIQSANKDLIKDVNLIYPGQVLKIPALTEELKKK